MSKEKNIQVGDDITLGGTVVYVSKLTDTVVVKTKSGDELTIYKKDIKTIHPYKPLPKTDERRGK